MRFLGFIGSLVVSRESEALGTHTGLTAPTGVLVIFGFDGAFLGGRAITGRRHSLEGSRR